MARSSLEIWRTQDGAKLRHKANLYDEKFIYPLDLGEITEHDPLHRSATNPDHPLPSTATRSSMVRFSTVRRWCRWCGSSTWTADGQIVGGRPVDPGSADAERGELRPADRRGRFGAFPQKLRLSGRGPGSGSGAGRPSAAGWTFEDATRPPPLAAGSTTDYNAILKRSRSTSVLRAGISLANVTGKLVKRLR